MLRINYNAETGETTMEEVEDIMIEESPVEPDLIKASIVIEPTIEERVTNTETKVVTIEEVIDVLVGGTI